MKKALPIIFCLSVFFISSSFSTSFHNQNLTVMPGPGGVGSTDGLSNLKLWLKADAGTTLDVNDLVSTWLDQSGNGFDVIQMNQNKRPLFQPTGLNGQACLFFNENGPDNTFLNNTINNLAGTGSARTIFIVGRMNKCSGQGGTLLANRRSSSVYRSMFHLSPIDGLLYVYSDGNDILNDASIDLSLYDDGQSSFLYTQISSGAGNKLTQRLNGNEETISRIGVTSSETGSNGFTIGLSEDDAQSPWGGQIAEIIVYDRELTAQEIVNVEAYLASKYPASSANITGTNTIPATEPGSGYALNFNGIDNRVIMGDELDMGINNFTLEAWIYTVPGSFTADLSDFGKRIISKGSTNITAPTGAGYGLQLYFDGLSNVALFFIGDNTTSLGVEATGLEENKWYHIAGVREGNVVHIYINGILVSTNTNVPNILNVDNNSYFSLGCITRLPNAGPNPTYSEHFKGTLDEVRVWHTALTQSEIRANMCTKTTEKHPQACSLAAYYRMDNGTGGVVTDLVRKTDAPITGATWELSAAPLGDISDFDYNDITSISAIANPTSINENLLAAISSGTADGIHTYFVGELPNSTIGATGFGSNDRYFGVHVVNGNAATYDIAYEYTGNPYVNTNNEATLLLLKRDNNADATWEATNATLNTGTNLLTSIGESTEYALGSSGLALPVDLINFNAKVINDRFIRLSWQTLTEQNNKGFELQRGQNGKDFQAIAWIDGQVNSATIHSYDQDDLSVEKGVHYFYRLKQIDFDNSNHNNGTYSEIVSAVLKGSLFQGEVFPNPINDELNVYFTNSDTQQNKTINIYEFSGKLCWNKQYIQLPKKLKLALDFLPSGIYFITTTNQVGQVLWSEKIVLDR